MEPDQQIRILIVEDEMITADALAEMLADMGHEVVGRARTGWDAVVKSKELVPNLVLMDIRLKGEMDGVSAAQRIQFEQDIPVVYLTAYSDDETLKRVLHSGAYGFLVKPCDPDELKQAIAKALRQHRIRKAGQGGS